MIHITILQQRNFGKKFNMNLFYGLFIGTLIIYDKAMKKFYKSFYGKPNEKT